MIQHYFALLSNTMPIAATICIIALICLVLAIYFHNRAWVRYTNHLCSVCGGRGEVKVNSGSTASHIDHNGKRILYSADPDYERCRTCNGSGTYGGIEVKESGWR